MRRIKSNETQGKKGGKVAHKITVSEHTCSDQQRENISFALYVAKILTTYNTEE